MAANKLGHLVGDYQSDSDNDDSERKTAKAITTDWTQCTDASTGHPYYWNIVTKEVTWDVPTEYQRFLEHNNHTNVLKKWSLCYTQDDNAPYYFNEVTREISWEKPVDFVETSNNHSNNSSRQRDESKPSVAGEKSNNTKTLAKLNLVPEYNSDESDDETAQPVGNPLFPSSGDCLPAQNKAIITIENRNESHEIQPESHPPNSPKKESIHKEKPSFASIITGGRSPQHETVDIKLYTNHVELDENMDQTEENPADAEVVPQKTFQRKRRIEFNVGNVQTKKATNEAVEPEPAKESSNTLASLKSKYTNFQKGETEFVDQTQPNASSEPENNAAPDELKDEQQLLEAKLNFLCQGRTDVSPVQVIQIQLQALQAAHVADALHSDYLLEWMKNISNDLIKLETDAAPNGWKCLWNREKAQYCYENITTGEIKWNYPEEELKENTTEDATLVDDDAMDICTTPPPNEHEDLSAAYYQTTECQSIDCAPPPPKWSGENSKNNNEKPLDDELASFYSDIAKLEPEASNEDNSCDRTSPNHDRSASPENPVSETDDKKKKKKKKSKKLEPWRSGNLETWINKWQKAQKELDG